MYQFALFFLSICNCHQLIVFLSEYMKTSVILRFILAIIFRFYPSALHGIEYTLIYKNVLFIQLYTYIYIYIYRERESLVYM